MRSHEPSNNIFRKSRIRRTPSHLLRVYLCGIVIYSSMRRGGLAVLRIWVSEEKKEEEAVFFFICTVLRLMFLIVVETRRFGDIGG
jgi:hypothetical protein